MTQTSPLRVIGLLLLLWLAAGPAAAQQAAAQQAAAQQTAASTQSSSTPPANYVIGPDDILSIVFWRENELSTEVTVRPDGMISLPLLNEIAAAGITPEQLRLRVAEAADQLIEDPTVSVVVKQINSRKVFITGNVAKPAPYPLLGPTTVVQLIAMAGGVLEYADRDNITIVRSETGQPTSFRFNYDDVMRRRNLQQNIVLKPGDTVIVP